MVAVDPLVAALVLARLVLFALAGGLTVISFRAYRASRTKRLESAFVGFAFISMGVALGNLATYANGYPVLFDLVQTLPFIVGFAMLYASLYR
ncbi:MAG: hypothetical protein ABEJ81_07215 [Haloferacaceae archaeon]